MKKVKTTTKGVLSVGSKIITGHQVALALLVASSFVLGLNFIMMALSLEKPQEIIDDPIIISNCAKITQRFVDSDYPLSFRNVDCVEFLDYDNDPTNNVINMNGEYILFDGNFEVRGNGFKLLNTSISLKDRVKLRDLEITGPSNEIFNDCFNLYDNTEVINTKADNCRRGYDLSSDGQGGNPVVRNSYASNSEAGFWLWAGEVFDSKAEYNDDYGFWLNKASAYNVESYHNNVGINLRYYTALSGATLEYNTLGLRQDPSHAEIANVISRYNENGGWLRGYSTSISNSSFVDNDVTGLSIGPGSLIEPGTFCNNGDMDLILSGTFVDGQFIADNVERTDGLPLDTSAFTACNSYNDIIIPEITSPLAVNAIVGNNFNYTITADNNPVSFSATNLSPGLLFSTTTGEIYGVPTDSGTYAIYISAINEAGVGTEVLTLIVEETPDNNYIQELR